MKKKIFTVVCSVITVVALATVNMASIFIWHQPATPDCLK